MHRIIIAGGVLVAAAYGAVVAYMYATQDARVWPATVNATTPPPPEAGNYQRISLTMPDGTRLNGIVAPRWGLQPSPTLVVVFGGNAHDVGGLTLFLKTKVWPGAEVAVAGVAYRGYPMAANPENGGRSGGTPSQPAVLADAVVQVKALQALVKPSQTVLMGYSIGSAVATYVAAQPAVAPMLAGAILVTPFTSLTALAEDQYPWLPVHALMRSPMPTATWLQSGTVPLALFSTPDDGLIPPSHIALLKQAAGARVRMDARFPGSTHGTILDDTRMPRALQVALAGLLAAPVPQREGSLPRAPFPPTPGNAISKTNP